MLPSPAPMLPPLPDPILDPIVTLALAEDLGRAGDITSAATIPSDHVATYQFVSRKSGVIAGWDAASLTARKTHPELALIVHKGDGAHVEPGDIIGALSGPTRAILTAERTMLNFLGRMSGIASLTARYVEAVRGTGTRIVCTRKTTPGLRALEKRAVLCGGGTSHRYGLDDAILIKDNHIAACGGVAQALAAAKAHAGHLRMIEIEVDTLDQLAEALPLGPHAVLLDNMDISTLKRAVAMINGRAIAEASGGVTLETVRAIAETGVNVISVGALTHSAPNFDIGLDSI
jgi:nicotinate-nucleotide pyrophosphorylase (carboxylating)